MKKILFFILIPFACYSQDSTNVPTRINRFIIECISGTDKSLADFFYMGGQYHYRDSAEYVTMEYDSLRRKLTFFIQKETVAFYNLDPKNKNRITNSIFYHDWCCMQMPGYDYTLKVENIEGNVFRITVKPNWWTDLYLRRYNNITITARLTSGVFALQQNTDSSSFKPPLLTVAQKKRLFSF
ncbi:hypothetical protein [Mucilaginibacter psychrotolerans]|uniref:Uncharacterized protein n=1 Tax=Mucilaginibacter psychrotolerans TaxID=1524096 RepID=A0A4Y8SKF8_9SPHI|nr:hypothetical protein [Mucilaginibacter psychrotolerans]TFF39161.1 hypothetical protein E2R66_05940 [Mucilaginibacter psychrotolerans]